MILYMLVLFAYGYAQVSISTVNGTFTESDCQRIGASYVKAAEANSTRGIYSCLRVTP